MTKKEVSDALDAIEDAFDALDKREKAAKAKYNSQLERLQKLQDAALAAFHAEQNEITDAKRPLFDELRRIDSVETPLDNLSELINFEALGFEQPPHPKSLEDEQ